MLTFTISLGQSAFMFISMICFLIFCYCLFKLFDNNKSTSGYDNNLNKYSPYTYTETYEEYEDSVYESINDKIKKIKLKQRNSYKI